MEQMIELLNKIRSEASPLYQERVPKASQTNLDEIRFAMTEGPDKAIVANEFMSAILNKVALTKIHNKLLCSNNCLDNSSGLLMFCKCRRIC